MTVRIPGRRLRRAAKRIRPRKRLPCRPRMRAGHPPSGTGIRTDGSSDCDDNQWSGCRKATPPIGVARNHSGVRCWARIGLVTAAPWSRPRRDRPWAGRGPFNGRRRGRHTNRHRSRRAGQQGLTASRSSTAVPIPRTVSTSFGGGGSPGQAARGYEPVVPSPSPPLRRRHETGLNCYGEQLGPSLMQFDALSIALEIAEPSVPAATANPAAIMASNSAYSAAAAPPSSRQKRARKPTVLVILDLPLYPWPVKSAELPT